MSYLDALGSSGRRLLNGFLDLLFPPRCLLCGALTGPAGPGGGPGRGDLCPDCLAGLPPLPESHCLRCGRPFETSLPQTHLCGRCLDDPPAYDLALAPGLYESALRIAIHRLKYSGRTELTRPLAEFMAFRLEPPFRPPQADLILPVPLHRRRLRQRGFNQALLLARALFGPWAGSIRSDLLVRTRWTEPQVNLKGPERMNNVRRAFAVTEPRAVKGRSIMIVDDVYTTGATVMECARALKKAGAARVLVLTLARVP